MHGKTNEENVERTAEQIHDELIKAEAEADRITRRRDALEWEYREATKDRIPKIF